MPRVSVIISNRNDTAMLAITLRSAIEEIAAVPGGGEIIIADNSDEKYKDAVLSVIPNGYIKDKTVKIVHQDFPCLFTARELAAKEASGDYLFCVDSHCLFGRNVIIDSVHFMNRHKNEPVGFAHPPVNWLCQHERASKHDMRMLHGTWGNLYDCERKISWKGMPWICKTDWFINTLNGYGALSKNRLSWGGGDMYLGLKTWILGYENWAIPSRPVIHIGPFPKLVREQYKYRLYGKSGDTINYIGWLVAMLALGAGDYIEKKLKPFMKDRFNFDIDEHMDEARRLASEDASFIENNKKRTFKELMSNPWDTDVFLDCFKQMRSKTSTAKSIKREDWVVIDGLVKQHQIKNVLEFGAGLSTILLSKMGVNVNTYETDKQYLSIIEPMCRGAQLNHWDGISGVGGAYDFAIVDGTSPRQKQMEIAKCCAPIVLVHDGYTPPDRQAANAVFSDWQEIKVESRRSRVFKCAS